MDRSLEAPERERRRWPGLAIVMLTALLQACTGPALGPWHTERLHEEFTTRTDEITDLDDYLALEERLFAELDDEVYGRVDTGPGETLVRYSRGSAADPSRWEPNWNRSFELPAERAVGGVLLLHGMSDSPYSLRALGQALNGRGFHVLGLRLPGHGTAPSGLTRIRWQDMVAATKLGMAHLEAVVVDAPLHIVGYSTGASLAVDYALDALEDPGLVVPASLVLVSPAIGVSRAAGLARWRSALGRLPGLRALEWLRIEPEFDPYKYNSFATNAGDQVHRLTRRVGRRVAATSWGPDAALFPPTLVFKSTVDATVSTQAVVDRFLGRLSTGRHELVLFDVNRAALKAPLLVDDPGPQTARLMDDAGLPFAVTLVGNEGPESRRVVARRKPPYSTDATSEVALDEDWPAGVISLSHVALPFPPDDPLYGAQPPAGADGLFLGQLAIRGERGLLKISSDWLLRLRHNPFYDYLEDVTLRWITGEPDAD
ncbi:MAG: alpha/beta hydrolase [Thiohalocapsa sp.]|jgi:alpha-beta hydrolase superfamily lysophospholipase